VSPLKGNLVCLNADAAMGHYCTRTTGLCTDADSSNEKWLTKSDGVGWVLSTRGSNTTRGSMHPWSGGIFLVLEIVMGHRGWRKSRAFAYDPKGRGFESLLVLFQVTALGKLLTCMCLCHQAV